MDGGVRFPRFHPPFPCSLHPHHPLSLFRKGEVGVGWGSWRTCHPTFLPYVSETVRIEIAVRGQREVASWTGGGRSGLPPQEQKPTDPLQDPSRKARVHGFVGRIERSSTVSVVRFVRGIGPRGRACMDTTSQRISTWTSIDPTKLASIDRRISERSSCTGKEGRRSKRSVSKERRTRRRFACFPSRLVESSAAWLTRASPGVVRKPFGACSTVEDEGSKVKRSRDHLQNPF